MPYITPNHKNNHFSATVGAATTRTLLTYGTEKISKQLQNSQTPIRSIHELTKLVFGENNIHNNLMQKIRILYHGAMPWGISYKTVQMATLGELKPLQQEMQKTFNGHPLAADIASGATMAAIQTPMLQFLNNMKTANQAGNPPPLRLFGSKPLASFPACSMAYGNIKPTHHFTLASDLKAFPWKNYLFKNAGITATRNFSFLTTLALTRSGIQKTLSGPEHKPLTPSQDVSSSIAGIVLGTLISSPLDIIKTRKQLLPIGKPQPSSLSLFKTMIKQEGIKACTKGLVPSTIEILGTSLFFVLQSTLLNDKDTELETEENASMVAKRY